MADPAQTQGDLPTPAQAAAQAVVADPVTASLLAKHSAGEKLSQSEYGKIGAWARIKNFVAPKSGPAVGLAQSTPGAGSSSLVAAVASGKASADGLAPVPVDPGLARRTTASILKRCDTLTVNWLTGHAEKAGAQGAVLDRFRQQASLPPPDRELLADLSPDILTELGVDPHKYPLLTAGAVLGVHVTGLLMAVSELKQMQHKQRVERLKEEGKRPEPPVTAQGAVTRPATVTAPGATPSTIAKADEADRPKITSANPFEQ